MIGLDRLAEAPTGLLIVLKATAVLAAAWLCHAALARANPRWRVLTWRCATIGLAAVAALAFAPPLATWRVAAPAVEPGPPVIASPSFPEPGRPREVAPPIAPPMPIATRVAPRVDPKPASTPVGAIDRATWLTVAWLAGVAVGLARLAIGSLRLRRIVRRASEAPTAARESCLATAEGLGLRRRARVVVSPDIASPCIAGLARPTILLPAGMGLDAPGPDLDAVLIHELAHVRNGDLAWNDLLGLASLALWFHPLAWRIRVAHASACDAVCDAVAVDRLGDVATYGRALARLALRASAAPPARGLAMARACDLRRRVESLQRMVYRSPLPRRLVMPALLLSAALIVLVGGAAVIRAQDAPANPDEPPMKTLTVRVVEAETGQALPGVEVTYRHHGRPGSKRVDGKLTTDADGSASVKYDPSLASSNFAITLRKPGFVPAHVLWSGERRPIQIPDVKELKMPRGTTIGGVVTDEAGRGIEGATVTLSVPPTESDLGNYRFSLATPTTDAQGRWRIDEAPSVLQGVAVRVEHPRYRSSHGGLARGLDGVTAVLKKGGTVRGKVVGPDGQPVADAVVSLDRAEFSPDPPTSRTDAAGGFSLENCEAGPGFLTVQAEGLAPEVRAVEVAEGETTPPTIALGPGSTLRVRVVDVQGRPVVGAYVAVDRWRDRQSIRFRANTDAEGRVAWRGAPGDAVLFDIFLDGYMRARLVPLTAGEEQIVVLYPALTITGAVTDAKTGRPIPKFTVFQGRTEQDRDGVTWRRDEPAEFTEGRYVQSMDFPARSHHLRVEAPGYRPAESRAFRSDEGATTEDFALEPRPGLDGVVLLPDGRPAAGAEVALVLPNIYTALRGDHFEKYLESSIAKAGDDGRFNFSKPEGPFTLVAAADAGLALATPEEFAGSATLTLRPWGRIEGRVMIGREPGAGAGVTFQPDPNRLPRTATTWCELGASTQADAEGRFILDKVAPFPGYVGRVLTTDIGDGMSSNSWVGMKAVEVKPGETTRTTLGGDGRRVVGRVVLDGPAAAPVDWSRNEPARITPSPGILDRLLARNTGSWTRYAGSFDAEGRFRADDVPPGPYLLTVDVTTPAPPGSRRIPETIARGRLEFVVPAGDVASAVDVGEVIARLERRLNVGDEAPALDLERLDGPKGRFMLGDRRGKVVVLDFWATWCGPCRDEMPALMDLAKAHGGDPRFELVGVSCDEAPGVAAGFVAKEGLTWTQAFAGPMGAGAAQDYGVRAIPSTFLIGPDGRVLATGLRGEQLREAVAKALAALEPSSTR
ncbi:carboxypeptidase regulatory-like domain-containing protein [Paludisphaera sp.]|uniref:carboxypeptidase regulatory-like domain-containing protein n=1 Tax=Paludisphaera sp. TaxID=2017432 RepID=UPI00301DC3E8